MTVVGASGGRGCAEGDVGAPISSSTAIDGNAIRTRLSLLHLVERSITAWWRAVMSWDLEVFAEETESSVRKSAVRLAKRRRGGVPNYVRRETRPRRAQPPLRCSVARSAATPTAVTSTVRLVSRRRSIGLISTERANPRHLKSDSFGLGCQCSGAADGRPWSSSSDTCGACQVSSRRHRRAVIALGSATEHP
jgi:hypothetical protein